MRKKEINLDKYFQDYNNSIKAASVCIDENTVKQFDLIKDEVVVNRFVYRDAEALHTHNFIEFCYVESGIAEHFVNGKKFRMERGQMAILYPGVKHEFVPVREATMSNIMFSSNLLKSVYIDESTKEVLQNIFRQGTARVVQFFGMTMVDIEQIVAKMVEEFSLKRTGYREVMCNYLAVLLIHIVRRIKEDIGTLTDKETRISKTIPKILEYVEENYEKKLTLDEVAKIGYYNRKYFCTLFRENVGKTFSEYLTELRVQKAMDILLSSDIAVDDVCYKVGFSDKKTYYKQFKAITGTTPAKFRKTKKQAEEEKSDEYK